MKGEPKFISIFRVHNGDKSTSSLAIDGDELKVLGQLPHGCKIDMTEESAKQLVEYLIKTYLEGQK